MILCKFVHCNAASAIVAIAIVASTTAAVAQDKTGPNLGAPAAGSAPGEAATMGLAQDLFALGVAQEDAVTVLAAAKLAASVDLAATEPAALDPARVVFDHADPDALRKTATSAPGAPNEIPAASTARLASKATFFAATSTMEGAADTPVTAETMFSKARDLAANDDAVLALIDDALAETARGRVGGSVEWLSRLPSGQTDVWEISFNGNAYAEVAVVGDGDANLDVAVTDENGHVICYDASGSDRLYCDWTPAWDGFFYVTVQNMGSARNSYYLMTN
jgi:hypothetical protein